VSSANMQVEPTCFLVLAIASPGRAAYLVRPGGTNKHALSLIP
jgi:hypothetical protein